MDLEADLKSKKRVIRKALEELPNSVRNVVLCVARVVWGSGYAWRFLHAYVEGAWGFACRHVALFVS